MNDTQIENLLRKGPALRTPEGLLEKLVADIHIPRTEADRAGWTTSAPWFKRWLPALSFAVILLACVMAIAVQTNILASLKQQNDALRATTGNLDALRADNAEFQKLSNENQQLDRLRKDHAELL